MKASERGGHGARPPAAPRARLRARVAITAALAAALVAGQVAVDGASGAFTAPAAAAVANGATVANADTATHAAAAHAGAVAQDAVVAHAANGTVADAPVAQPISGAPVVVTRGIAYTTGPCPGRGVEPELADLYQPQGVTSSPLVILVHGGSFIKGDRVADGFPRVATELASLGWSAASIDYCLPPAGTPGYPTEVSEVREAIGFFSRNALHYGLDPRRIAVWGASAGASLALDSATLLDRGGAHPIVAAVGWSGAYDLGVTPGTPVPVPAIVDNYLGCDAASSGCRATAGAASAIEHIERGATPPMYLANSTAELMPLAQLTAMRSVLEAAGVPVSAQIIPGDRHAMAYTDLAFCPSVSFLERYLGAVRGVCAVPERVVVGSAGMRRLAAEPAGERRRSDRSRLSSVWTAASSE